MINIKGKQRDLDIVKPHLDTLIQLSKKDGFYFKVNADIIPIMPPLNLIKNCEECLATFTSEQFQYIEIT
jgi:hypothetical protein